MERELFRLLIEAVDGIAGAGTRPRKGTYTHRSVLGVLIWAVLHDRPISWATRRENWPWHDRTRPLPSNATMSRRLRDPAITELVIELIASLRVEGEGARTLVLDGRSLAIARHSADPDAAFGRAAGGLANGYKLHEIADLLGNCRCFRVDPLRVSEQAVAKELIADLASGEADELLADANYDSNALYDLAGERGIQMIAQRRRRNAKGVGHRRHSEHRLRALATLNQHPGVIDRRRMIESCFGTQGNVVGGLGPLPNHVRRLHRVRLWVAVKIAIDAAHRHRRLTKTVA